MGFFVFFFLKGSSQSLGFQHTEFRRASSEKGKEDIKTPIDHLKHRFSHRNTKALEAGRHVYQRCVCVCVFCWGGGGE